MSNEEKFKQSLKSIVESKEFAFDEKDWDKAAAFVQQKRTGSKVARIGLVILALAGLLGTGIVLMPSESDRTQQAAQVKTAETSSVINSNEETQTGAKLNQNTSTSAPAASFKERANETQTSQHSKTKNTPSPVNGIAVSKDETIVKESQAGQMTMSLTKREKTNQDKTDVPKQPTIPAGTNASLDKDAVAVQQESVTETVVPIVTAPLNETNHELNKEEGKNTEEKPASVETVTQAPAIVAASKNESSETVQPKAPRMMLFSLEAGASYQAGWKNDGADRDANGFNPVAGIHYMNPINDRFTLSFGIQYQRTGHLEAYSNTTKQTRYSFGEESEVTTITPSKLHYLAVPIRLYYKLNDNNIIGGSYSIGYLLDVESNVETYTLKVGKQNNIKNYTTRGYTDGFSMFDSQVALFYRRHLYGDFSLHGEVFFGLSDVKQNNFFGGDKSQRNSGLRLMLVYGIHNHNK